MRSIYLPEKELKAIKQKEVEKTAKTIIRIINKSLFFTPYRAKELEKEIKRKLKI